jgi:hypothetical protein
MAINLESLRLIVTRSEQWDEPCERQASDATHDENQEILDTSDSKARIDRVSRILRPGLCEGSGQISKGKAAQSR